MLHPLINIFMLVTVLLYSSNTFSMEEIQTSKLYINEKSNPDYFAKKMLTIVQNSHGKEVNDASKNSIFVNANVLTYEKLGDELLKAHKDKVNVTVLLAQKSLQYGKEKIKTIFKELPTRVYLTKKGDEEVSEDHAKLFLYDVNGKQGYSIGSANSSSYGLFHNSEVTHFVENEKENYQKILESLQAVASKSVTYNENFKKDMEINFSPLKLGKDGLKDTPEKKRTVHTTLDKNFIELILNRLDSEKFTAGDTVCMSTYTFNNKKITEALSNLLDKGIAVKIYIDKNPLTTLVGSDQIKTLIEKGAQVRAYIRDDQQNYIHHAKFLLLHRNADEKKEIKEKKMTIVLTQNLLDSKDFDVLSLDQHEQTFDSLSKIIEGYNKNKDFKLITKENFDDVLNGLKTEKTKKAKRKLIFENDDKDKKIKI